MGVAAPLGSGHVERRERAVGNIARSIRAAGRGVRTLSGFWLVLALALVAPLGMHRCETSADRDTAENARLNAASEAIFRWQEVRHFKFTRTATGATISLRIPAAEWSALSSQEQAAVCQLLHQVVWRGGRVERCLIRDECGSTLASG